MNIIKALWTTNYKLLQICGFFNDRVCLLLSILNYWWHITLRKLYSTIWVKAFLDYLIPCSIFFDFKQYIPLNQKLMENDINKVFADNLSDISFMRFIFCFMIYFLRIIKILITKICFFRPPRKKINFLSYY